MSNPNLELEEPQEWELLDVKCISTETEVVNEEEAEDTVPEHTITVDAETGAAEIDRLEAGIYKSERSQRWQDMIDELRGQGKPKWKDRRLQEVRPLDLIGFIGETIVSKMIRKLEARAAGRTEYDFSHVGIVVTKDILPVVSLDGGKNVHLEEGVHYLLESTISSGTPDVCDESHRIGVQLRNLSEVIGDGHGDVFHCRLKKNPLDHEPLEDVRTRFSIFFHEYWKQSYNLDPLSAAGLLFPVFRGLRSLSKPVYTKLRRKESQLCSELAARCYQRFGLIPLEFDCADVTPTDFCGNDLDGIPRLFEEPRLVAYGL